MSDKKLSEEILSGFDGKDNILFAAHCATRLRLTIKDEDKVDEENVKKIKGVLGLVKNENEYQVIIGTGVSSVYLEFSKLGDFGSGDTKQDVVKENTEPKKKEKKNYYLIATDFIAGTVLPSLPIIVAGGMMSAVLVMCKTPKITGKIVLP